MTATQTIETINAHLDKHPADWVSRLELADLYEEAGEGDASRMQRWLVKYKKAPQSRIWAIGSPRRWHWWAFAIGAKQSYLGGLSLHTDDSGQGYSTRSQAEEGLMRVLIAANWPPPDLR